MKQHDLTPHDVPLGDITTHPENPNHGDKDAIRDSIVTNGFFEPVAVQRSTGYVVHGNHRYLVARDMGLETIPAVYLDISDAEARRILLAGNSTGQKAVMDDLGIGRVLNAIKQETDDLAATIGSGYESEEVEDFLLMLAASEAETARYDAPETLPDYGSYTPPPSSGGGFVPAKAAPGLTVTREDTPDPEDSAGGREHPTNPQRRLIILDLPLDIYAWLSDRLHELSADYGTNHPTLTILRAVGDATGTQPPDFHGPLVSDPDRDGIPEH